VDPPLGFVTQTEAYLTLLLKWNRRINLTALPLDPPSDEAIDRLIIEPLVASRQVKDTDRLCIDVGSGGGSPGIPFHLACPAVALVLVEVKVRKSAFLREVVRQLGLENVEVENRRFEELLARSDLLESADIVTVRAVRPNVGLWNTVQAFLRPGGRVLWFGSSGGDRPVEAPLLVQEKVVPLVPSLGSELVILGKARQD
jgi:16S rRNA (guanine527-N7)-methyltransferase